MNSVPTLAAGCLGALCLIGAYLDVRYRRLPNLLVLVTLVAGIGWGWLNHDPGWIGSALLHALIALVVGMGLFRLGMIGGGDAKFYAAVAAWLPLKFALLMLLLVSSAGLVLALIMLARRRIVGPPKDSASTDFRSVPYGLAIGIGAISTAVMVRL